MAKMQLIPLKCEFCSGDLIRVSSDTVVCKFCNTGYLLGETPTEPISIPEAEPARVEPVQVSDPEPDDGYVPCAAEKAIRLQMAEEEYQFWRTLPARPTVVTKKRKVRIDDDTFFHLPVVLLMFGVMSWLMFGGSKVWGFAAVGTALLLGGAVVGGSRVWSLWQSAKRVDTFVKNQTRCRKKIRDLRASREWLQ